MANIKEQLLAPESGWRRIDNTDSNIVYNGTGWEQRPSINHYKSTCILTQTPGENYVLYVYTSRIRIISDYHYNMGIFTIDIDGNYTCNVDCYQTGEKYQHLMFEKNDLEKTVHKITVTLQEKVHPGLNMLVLDAIDIDEDGKLLSQEELPCYIKQNNKYYSFSKDNYDTTTKMYKEITLDDINNGLYLCQLTDLTKEVTIGDETFRPIDKFSNFKIVSKYNIPKTIIGRKTKSSMIIANGDIYTKVASNIDKFTLTNTTTNNSCIKMAVSFDNGSTWKSYTDNAFTDLSITIPCKDYNSLTTEELTNWNNAKETIMNNGFTPDILEIIDFNTIVDLNTIRFAYVLYQDLISDDCKVNTLSWQFDAKGSFQKMKDSEITTSFSNGVINLIPNENQNMIITNYIY